MMMLTFTEQEVQNLINVLTNANSPWVVTNPLIMKIMQQAQSQPKGNSHDRHIDADRSAAERVGDAAGS